MLLKSMEVQGFKTFPDKTRLTFDRGITAVVGPNGSGKSNISDAVRWVLGEQSAKALRCSKMEDVVFNGTDSRKPQGFAEVTLTIDNKDRLLPFDGDSIAVTRRYYRSGESEYLINKSAVRLKDIHELFMDTGLGRDGYSMIGQGKIDGIVASKSEDRREIFEEAAGISRYRYRKIEAERKLTLTEANLVRLRDIVGELEQRVEPLKAQAKKAEIFLKYSEEKKGLEIAVWLDTLNKSSNILKEQEDKISVARAQHAEIEKLLEQITSKTEEIYIQNGKLSSQTDEIRRQCSQYNDEQGENKSRISVLANDILHNNQTVERLNGELEALELGARDARAQIEKKKAEILLLEEKRASAQTKYDDAADRLNSVIAETSRSGDEFQNLTYKLTKADAEYSDLRATVLSCDAAEEELKNRILAAEKSKLERKDRTDDLKSMLEQYDLQVKKNSAEASALKNSIDGIELKLASKRKKSEQYKTNADNIALDAQEKLRRAKLLENLEQNLEGFAHSVRSVVQSAEKGNLRGVCGPVSRVISVPKEYTLAIETALGAAMQHIVTETEEDAKQAIRFLKQKEDGRATFLPISTIKGKILNEPALCDCYGFVGIASSLCVCSSRYDGILAYLLGRTVLAQDLNSAAAIAKKFSYRFKVVSLDGQVINAGGSLTGGSSNRKSGLLSRTAEIEDLKKEAKLLLENAKKAKAEYNASVEELSALEAALLGSNGDYNRVLQEAVRIDAERRACINEISSLKSTVEQLSEEIKASDEKIRSLHSQKESADARLKELSAEISNFESSIAAVTGSRADLSQKREELSEILQNSKLEILSLEKDIENIRNEISYAEISDAQRLNKKQALEQEIDALNMLNVSTAENIEHLKAETDKLQLSVDNLEREIESINFKRDELEKATIELHRTERDKTAEREIIGREIARLEERRLNLQKQYDDITQKLWDEYELTYRQAEQVCVKIENIPEGQKRLNELRQKIKALGSVNVAAIEEYKEVFERYSFISAQVNDVEKSKKEIEAVISRLTRQMKDSFVESFQKINSYFTLTFRELFGGGTASLSLSDPEDILSSGIDITVHPPGKIVSRLESLSGGEKALVAIALYFSIMKVRPAPFCILDEIEAALDEVNVERFAKYMRTMCVQTQFICITHRRGTMEEADVLYGVTMQDEGVSKLLELKTDELAEKLGI